MLNRRQGVCGRSLWRSPSRQHAQMCLSSLPDLNRSGWRTGTVVVMLGERFGHMNDIGAVVHYSVLPLSISHRMCQPVRQRDTRPLPIHLAPLILASLHPSADDQILIDYHPSPPPSPLSSIESFFTYDSIKILSRQLINVEKFIQSFFHCRRNIDFLSMLFFKR